MADVNNDDSYNEEGEGGVSDETAKSVPDPLSRSKEEEYDDLVAAFAENFLTEPYTGIEIQRDKVEIPEIDKEEQVGRTYTLDEYLDLYTKYSDAEIEILKTQIKDVHSYEKGFFVLDSGSVDKNILICPDKVILGSYYSSGAVESDKIASLVYALGREHLSIGTKVPLSDISLELDDNIEKLFKEKFSTTPMQSMDLVERVDGAHKEHYQKKKNELSLTEKEDPEPGTKNTTTSQGFITVDAPPYSEANEKETKSVGDNDIIDGEYTEINDTAEKTDNKESTKKEDTSYGDSYEEHKNIDPNENLGKDPTKDSFVNKFRRKYYQKPDEWFLDSFGKPPSDQLAFRPFDKVVYEKGTGRPVLKSKLSLGKKVVVDTHAVYAGRGLSALESAYALATLAEAKGFKMTKLRGSKAFQQAAYELLTAKGIHVIRDQHSKWQEEKTREESAIYESNDVDLAQHLQQKENISHKEPVNNKQENLVNNPKQDYNNTNRDKTI